MGAQIKTLSFLAYIVRIYQEVIAQNSSYMVSGLLGLLTLCPMEVAHLRKELLIAARHILATELRTSTLFLSLLYITSFSGMPSALKLDPPDWWPWRAASRAKKIIPLKKSHSTGIMAYWPMAKAKNKNR